MMSGRESLFLHAEEGQKAVWERAALRDILGRMLFLSSLDRNCLGCLLLSTLNQGGQCCLWARCSTLSSDSLGACLSGGPGVQLMRFWLGRRSGNAVAAVNRLQGTQGCVSDL